MGTWNNSASQGKLAAHNMQGKQEPYETVPTYTSGLFDSKLAVMGATPEISSAVEGISRLDMENRTYRRLFFIGSRLVGAVLIGAPAESKPFSLIHEGATSRSQRCSICKRCKGRGGRMSLYTRRGDEGETGLLGHRRVSKGDPLSRRSATSTSSMPGLGSL